MEPNKKDIQCKGEFEGSYILYLSNPTVRSSIQRFPTAECNEATFGSGNNNIDLCFARKIGLFSR